ncbi:MAG: hypothetical protein J7604_25570 [Sporocytophaga sp.]|uniref:hypothetical protein n=1 Tax=Sporocytophaga sp. TaxID=2231183 RepID=UPI001B1758DC|nr:hypothetical protein [Sporocytophaga sp.]MBO9703599.1 hypothetical protein [Sporocytophaga sp.]
MSPQHFRGAPQKNCLEALDNICQKKGLKGFTEVSGGAIKKLWGLEQPLPGRCLHHSRQLSGQVKK